MHLLESELRFNSLIRACKNYMLVPQKMISATSTALDNYGIVRILLWSIVKFI